MNKIIVAAALGATTLSGAASSQSTTMPPPSDQQMQRPHHRMGGGMRGMMGPGALMRADLNHDGVITRAEVIADADQRFAAMDTDHNGTVTADERRAAIGAMRREHDTARPTADAPPGASGDLGFADRGMGKRRGRGGGRDMTQAQFRDRATRIFDRIDTNHNGQVDKNEIDAARMMMRARMSGADDAAPAPNHDH